MRNETKEIRDKYYVDGIVRVNIDFNSKLEFIASSQAEAKSGLLVYLNRKFKDDKNIQVISDTSNLNAIRCSDYIDQSELLTSKAPEMLQLLKDVMNDRGGVMEIELAWRAQELIKELTVHPKS